MAGVDLTAIFGGQVFDASKNLLIEAALEYADRGLLVFPCHDISSGICSCGDSSCKSSGKHPRVNGWREQATTDSDLIRTWWNLWPKANIGIATGPQSGVWVLDVDKKDGGLETLERIVKENGPFLPTPTQQSGGGGLHYFFAYDHRVKSRVKAIEGIDTRSDGGLIIVSPSENSTGKYEWINDPKATPISKAPEWLIDMVKGEDKPISNEGELITYRPIEGDEIENALMFIDAFDRDTWLHVGMGLKAQGVSQGVWDNWAKSCPDKYSQKDQDSTWRSFKRDDIKIGTVIDLAKKSGYIPPAPPEADYSHIDLSKLLSTLGGEKEEPVDKPVDKPLGSVFSCAPGIIGEIAQFHEDTAPKSQPELAVACAVALLSTICARKFKTSEQNLSSLYVLGVAKSTAGKEHGAKVIESILEATSKMQLNGGSWFTSDSACYQSLLQQPRQIVVSDELGITVQSASADKSGMQLKLRSFLMQAITKLDSSVPPLRYSQRGLSEEQKKEGEAVLKCPALSLYGTTTSNTFFESLAMDQVNDGFLGRLLVVESTQPRRKMRRNRHSANQVPRSITQWISEVEARGGNLAAIEDGQTRPHITTIDFTEQAYAVFDVYEDRILKLQNELESEGLDALIGRAVEYAMRLSLIAQLAINPASSAIGKEAADWARDFVDHCYQTMLKRVRTDVKSSKHEKRMNEVLVAIQYIIQGGDEVTMTTLSRRTRNYTSSERNQIIQALVDTGEIYIETESSTTGRPKQVIKIKKNS